MYIYIIKRVKYLLMMLHESLTCFLEKLRYNTSNKLLATTHNALLESHMRYGCQIWGLTRN